MLKVKNNNKQPLATRLLRIASLGAFFFTSQLGAETIGKIIASKGECYGVIRGNKFPVKRGDNVETGEKFITGADGFLQLRFTDNGITALRPNTEYQIDKYNLSVNDPKKAEYHASVIKGQFRQLTGLIGKKNPAGYNIKTPLTTLGINGTYFGHRIVLSNGKLFEVSGTWRGKTLLTTSHSWLSIGPRALFHYGYVDSQTLTPVGLTDEPGVLEGLIPNDEPLDIIETPDFRETLNDFLNNISSFEQSVQEMEDIDLITDLQQLKELQDIANAEPIPPEPEPPVPPEPPPELPPVPPAV